MSSAMRRKEQAASAKRQRRYGKVAETARQADWRIVNNAQILNVIQAAGVIGGALRFGFTRDGGAYALGVYGDGPDVYTLYGGTVAEIEEHLTHLGDVFEAIAIEEGSEAIGELP